MSAPWTVDQIAAEVERFTYKPGWYLVVQSRTFLDGPPRLFLRAEMPDRDQPHVTTSVALAVPLPTFYDGDERQLAEWLRDLIGRMEEHETDEWLRRDGERIFDPHKEG